LAVYFVGIVTNGDEDALRRLWEERNFGAVTTLALERYGPEILGVLAAQVRSEPDADAAAAFSMFAEDLWRGIPGFRWRCTLRA
jgi:RNA polymerase sigma-70 factor (ECF subfamily)